LLNSANNSGEKEAEKKVDKKRIALLGSA